MSTDPDLTRRFTAYTPRLIHLAFYQIVLVLVQLRDITEGGTISGYEPSFRKITV